MLNKISIAMVLLLSGTVHAELMNLDNAQLLDVTGQGGVDLSWTLSLNHQYANDMSKKQISDLTLINAGNPSGAYYQYDCVANVLCRFAFSPNNHVEKVGNIDNKKWLVFKQIQGTIQIDKFSLDGSTIINKDGNPQTAMNLTFYDNKPLKIRNLGFSSLAVESNAEEGYLNKSTYTTYDNNKVVPAFDQGAETGFMGVNVHGNLHMSGNLKIFSYNCSGIAGSRC